MKSRKVIVATHGHFATGLKTSLEIIIGAMPHVQFLDCYVSEDFNLDQTIDEILNAYDESQEELFVFTDVVGGSVNNGFVKALSKKQFHLYSNINLAIMMDFLLMEPSAQELSQKINEVTFRVRDVNQIILQDEKDEGDL